MRKERDCKREYFLSDHGLRSILIPTFFLILECHEKQWN